MDYLSSLNSQVDIGKCLIHLEQLANTIEYDCSKSYWFLRFTDEHDQAIAGGYLREIQFVLSLDQCTIRPQQDNKWYVEIQVQSQVFRLEPAEKRQEEFLRILMNAFERALDDSCSSLYMVHAYLFRDTTQEPHFIGLYCQNITLIDPKHQEVVSRQFNQFCEYDKKALLNKSKAITARRQLWKECQQNQSTEMVT